MDQIEQLKHQIPSLLRHLISNDSVESNARRPQSDLCMCKVLTCMSACTWCTRVYGSGWVLFQLSFSVTIKFVYWGKCSHFTWISLHQFLQLASLSKLTTVSSSWGPASQKSYHSHEAFIGCIGNLICVPYTRKTNILSSVLLLGCYFDDFQIWLLIFNTQETYMYLNKTNLVFPTSWNQLKIVIIWGHIKQKCNLSW